jgi:hypothetical protein
MIKVLLYFIAFLLMPIIFVIGYLYLAMYIQLDPTSPLYVLFPRDLPEWLPVDLAIKSAAILGVMLVVWLIYLAIAEYRFSKKDLQTRKQQALNRFFSGRRDSKRSTYNPPND